MKENISQTGNGADADKELAADGEGSEQVKTRSPKESWRTDSRPNTLDLVRVLYTPKFHYLTVLEGNFAILTINEELRHKIQIAHDVLQTRQDLSRVLQGLFAEASAQVETRAAERQLAASREKEARHRKEYFGRLIEASKDNILKAEMQAALLRLQGRKAGLDQYEPAYHGEGVSELLSFSFCLTFFVKTTTLISPLIWTRIFCSRNDRSAVES